MDSGIYALAGTALGFSLKLFSDLVLASRARRREANYLAVVVSTKLDQFASQCAHVMFDGGRQDESGNYVHQTTEPLLKWDDQEVNWQTIPKGLLHVTLSFPARVDEVKSYLYAVFENESPPFDGYMSERQYEYAKLTLEALDIADALRKKAGLKAGGRREGAVDVSLHAKTLIRERDELRQRFISVNTLPTIN